MVLSLAVGGDRVKGGWELDRIWGVNLGCFVSGDNGDEWEKDRICLEGGGGPFMGVGDGWDEDCDGSRGSGDACCRDPNEDRDEASDGGGAGGSWIDDWYEDPDGPDGRRVDSDDRCVDSDGWYEYSDDDGQEYSDDWYPDMLFV
jgi:hypothetical protein